MQSFIKARLNKDNFWNLMFFLGMISGFGIAWLIVSFSEDKFPTSASIVCWITIIGVPWFVKRNSAITFDKEKKQFLNRNNEELNSRAPNFFLLIFLTGGLTALTGLVLDSARDSINDSITFAIICTIPILIPTLYCILKNLPIAVYFKKETWIGDGTIESYSSSDNWRSNSHHFSSAKKTSSSKESLITSPRYRYLSCNIFHKR